MCAASYSLLSDLVADHGPARGFDHLYPQPMLGIDAHSGAARTIGVRTGDRDETDFQAWRFGVAVRRERFGSGCNRKELRDGCDCGGRADRFEERPPLPIAGEQCADHSAFDSFAPEFVLRLLCSRLVSALAIVLAATASFPVKRLIPVERIVKRHNTPHQAPRDISTAGAMEKRFYSNCSLF